MADANQKIKGYLFGAGLGLLAGSILYFLQPVQWKGQALVRIGQISQGQNQSLEPMGTVMERLKSRSFVQAVADRAKINEIAALLNVDEGAGLTIKPTKNADSLMITVAGDSAPLVQASIEATVAELVSKHKTILDAYQADIGKELSKLDLELEVLSKRLASMLQGRLVATTRTDEESVLATGFGIVATQHDMDFKMNRASQLRESISSANNRPTSLLEPASICEKRMFSKLWRASLFGALVGILLSMIWGQLKNP